MKRLIIVGLAVLLVTLDAPTPAAPAHAVTRLAYDVTLSAAPAGQTVELSVPADRWPDLHPSVIERPGMERRMGR